MPDPVELGFKLLGGIGLFLMGMVLLTDGLKAFAGESLRRALVRFTGTPLKAFASGALVTLMVQSSSATTVTLIGFVSAGLITFPQAVGVVFGASLGTTGTGWIVSVLGLKVSLGYYALPLVGIGALMKLLGQGRARALGVALAGFGLIFIGIETLQDGMRGFAGIFNLAALPASGLWGHALAMAIGIVMTVIMQSSSAATATTLTALHTGAINFEQAAALVIGAAIGTTVTGALAAIGGSVPAKRTALAHVLFNLATGGIAILLLPLLLWGIGLAQQHLGLDPGAMSLAAFHTLFIALGVAVFLPVVEHFARWIERLLPDKGPALTRHLDATLLQAPAVALEATRRALRDIAEETFAALRAALAGSPVEETHRQRLHHALDQTQTFFSRIPPLAEDEPLSRARIHVMHTIDHLTRLQARLVPPAGMARMRAEASLKPAMEFCRAILESAPQALRACSTEMLLAIEQDARALTRLRKEGRLTILRQTVDGNWGPFEALEAMDAMRWLERVGNHTWRICHYLSEPAEDTKVAQPPLEMDE